MAVRRIACSELAGLAAAGTLHEELSAVTGPPVALLIDDGVPVGSRVARALATVPIVLLAPQGSGPAVEQLADVVAGAEHLDAVVDGVVAAPLASVALVLLLRGGDDRSIEEGLVAESVTYSMLQGGPEFQAWRAQRPVRQREDEHDVVGVARTGDELVVTLRRPGVHNAFSRQLRDGLSDALSLAMADRSIERVVLGGEGRSFCSGGDLDEFGTFVDPASAHLTRLTRSPARLCAELADRLEVRLKGAAMGAGIELSAFAQRIVADPGTTIALPEVPLGLVPGAGGTVSLPRRIGRQRTALLALAGLHLDAATALAWGLVDTVEPVS
jgi:enoyl-CoA hydratase/carnithine racemase